MMRVYIQGSFHECQLKFIDNKTYSVPLYVVRVLSGKYIGEELAVVEGRIE